MEGGGGEIEVAEGAVVIWVNVLAECWSGSIGSIRATYDDFLAVIVSVETGGCGGVSTCNLAPKTYPGSKFPTGTGGCLHPRT